MFILFFQINAMTPKNLVLVTLMVVGSVMACKEDNKNKLADKPLEKSMAIEQSLSQPLTSITGSWTGAFERDIEEKAEDKETGESYTVPANKITLFITSLEDGNISGYSVCAGNQRSFSGSYEQEGNNIKASLQEPGDNKYDGVFELTIAKENHTLTGKWTPFDKAQGSRHYNLQRKNFKYDTALGEYPEASTRLLTADDVNNLIKEDLRYMRNEIYARHGYSFKVKDVRQRFDAQDWYMPVSTDVRKKLSSIELKNEKLIRNFEKYAADSYDDFGR
jgi:hypothetical protein